MEKIYTYPYTIYGIVIYIYTRVNIHLNNVLIIKIPSYKCILVLFFSKSKNDIISISDSFDEMYENNKYLLCNDPEETKKVTKYMNEAVTLLQKQIETTVGYQNHFNYNNADIYTKKQDDADIGKLNITIENPDKV